MRDEARKPLLVVDAGGCRAGIPLACVRETMRPLAITAVAGAPHFVLGLAVIRGASVPVVDLGALVGAPSDRPPFGRFVTLAVDGRFVALAVERVIGVSELDVQALESMPPLLRGAAGDAVNALALLDAALLVLLEAGRLVPAVPLVEEARA
ncbi:MAG TPA: CheW domain-containing protein [Polyangiaceae bacterium]|nr:CheW domain-containing protein [Polyangiaceae bacterium]